MFDSEKLHQEVYEQFSAWEEDQLDLAEAVEWGRGEHRRAEARRRAHESAVRLGKITGARKKKAAEKLAASLPLLGHIPDLPALLAVKAPESPGGLAAPVVVRRDGDVAQTYRFAGGRALRCVAGTKEPVVVETTAPEQVGFGFMDAPKRAARGRR